MSFKTKIDGARAVLAFDNWPILLLGRLLYRETGLVVYCKKNLEILVDHLGGDENGTRECIVGNMYRKYVPLFHFPEPARVLDIGANGGGFPLMLMLEGVKLASVVSVEMNPVTYSRLLINLTNNIGPSTAINAAVSGADAPATILLTPSRGGTGYAMNSNSASASTPHVAVKTTTLESLCDEYFRGQDIDICKIDIEGAEYDVLDSTHDDLLRRIRYLIIEFHEASRTGMVLSRLAELGFSDLTQQENGRTGSKTEVRAFSGPLARV
ncbi:MAG TPA: FkbM family methyltransferase [Terracidiphilus sp.]|jgi:FkbM family methyltransferase